MSTRRFLVMLVGLGVLLPLVPVVGSNASAAPTAAAAATAAASTPPPNGKTCGGEGQPVCPPLENSDNCLLPTSQGGGPGVPDDADCPELFTLPAWSDAARWDQPQYYGTIEVADVNGNHQPDLVALGSQGIEIYELSPDHGSCGATNPAYLGCGTWVPINDRGNSYGVAQANGLSNTSLLLTGDVDGDPSGDDEIVVGQGTTLLVIDVVPQPGELSTLDVVGTGPAIDANGRLDGTDWSQPQYRSTIRLADFDGDGADELSARSTNGLWRWTYSGGTFTGSLEIPGFSDTGGYNQASYYQTWLTGDIDDNPGEDLVTRGASGLDVNNLVGGVWGSLPTMTDVADDSGFDDAAWWPAQYGATIQLADIDDDGLDEVLGRGATHLWSWDYDEGAWAAGVPGPTWSDAAGYIGVDQYSTISSLQLVGDLGAEVVSSNGTAFEAWQYDADTTTWSILPNSLPLPTSANWTAPRYYQSIRTTPVSADPALNALIYRDPLGIHSLDYDETAGWDETNADFLDVSSGPNADAYAAINCYMELALPLTIRSTYDTPQVGTISGNFAGRVPTAANDGTGGPDSCNPVAVPEANWTAVRTAIGNELYAASNLNDMFTEVQWVIQATFDGASTTLAEAQSALDASKSQKAPFKWGEIVAGLVEALGGGLEFKFEKPFAAISILITTGASSISAGVEFGNAKSEESSTEYEENAIEESESELQTRYADSVTAIEDERAAIVTDWGEMQTMNGLALGPWAYESANDPYVEAAAVRQFELHMWASAAPAANWWVYVCGGPGWINVSNANADHKRSECSNPYGYAGYQNPMPNGVVSAWIVNYLNHATTPQIKAPNSKLVNRVYDATPASCDTAWQSYSNSDNMGCPFGQDKLASFQGKGPWDLTCVSFYPESALVHAKQFHYPGPCDHGQDGPNASQVTFSDVPITHQFYPAIQSLAESDLVAGYPDGTFRPTDGVTRQALAAVMYRMAGSPPVPVPAPTFSDVPADHPFHDAIAWMASKGYTEGYADGTFRPGAPVTRQAAAAILFRFAGSRSLDGLPEPVPEFADVPDGHSFSDEITWLVGAGVAKGYDDGTFRPTTGLSRQALAQFLFTVWTSGWADNGTVPAPDVVDDALLSQG